MVHIQPSYVSLLHIQALTSAPTAFDPNRELVLKWCMLDFMLVLFRHRLLHSRDEPWIIDRCLEIACTIVETISTLAEQNVLIYLQDTSSCMTSSLAVLLQTVSSVIGPTDTTDLFYRLCDTQAGRNQSAAATTSCQLPIMSRLERTHCICGSLHQEDLRQHAESL